MRMSGVLSRLLQVCVQIDRLQGHCKSQEDKAELAALYQKRREILSGGRGA